jgi:hypothetical protein
MPHLPPDADVNEEDAAVSRRDREGVLQHVKARGTHLENQVYGRYRADVKVDAGYYELTFAKNLIPKEWRRKGIKPVIPPTAYNAVENAVDHVLTSPKITIPVRPSSADHYEEQEIAERKRLALRFWWETVEISGGAPLKAALKHLIKDGKLVLKKQIKWDLVPEEVTEAPLGLDEFIWEVEAVSPEGIYEDPDKPYDPAYVYEKYTITVETGKDTFAHAGGAWRLKNNEDLVEVLEYWSKPRGESRGQHIVWIEDENVVDTDNPYHWAKIGFEGEFTGYLPYVIRASGWGERKHDYDPTMYYVGILRRMRSLMDAQAQHLTDGSVQMKVSTFPATITSLPESVPINIGPGEITRKPNPDDTIEFLRPPELPRSLFDMISLISSEANAVSKFGALGGSPLRGVDTATEADTVTRNAAAKLNSPVLALRSALTEINKQILQDVENVLAQPVVLFGAPDEGESLVALDPTEINGFYHTTVELSTTDKAALDRSNARLWADLFTIFPDLSAKTAMTNAGIDDPQRERETRTSENIFNGQRMSQVREMLALAALGKKAELVRKAFEQTLQGEAEQADQGGAGDGSVVSAAGPAPGGAPGGPAIARSQGAAGDERADLAAQ